MERKKKKRNFWGQVGGIYTSSTDRLAASEAVNRGKSLLPI
jgi:hypothetical protein